MGPSSRRICARHSRGGRTRWHLAVTNRWKRALIPTNRGPPLYITRFRAMLWPAKNKKKKKNPRTVPVLAPCRLPPRASEPNGRAVPLPPVRALAACARPGCPSVTSRSGAPARPSCVTTGRHRHVSSSSATTTASGAASLFSD